MKRLLCLSVVLTGLMVVPSVSFARLGETEDNIVKRYGEPFEVMQQRPDRMWLLSPAEKVLKFKTRAFAVSVYIMDGRSAVEAYTFTKDLSGSTDPAVQAILRENVAGDAKWSEVPNPEEVDSSFKCLWVLEAGPDAASATISHNKPASMELKTKKFADARERK